MKMKMTAKRFLIATIGILVLSACTPPMPPEFKAQLAERYVTCITSDLTIAATPELTEVAQLWVDGLAENCNEFTGTVSDTFTPADVVVAGETDPVSCTVSYQAPIGIDSVSVLVTVDGLDGVIFSPSLLHRALSGQMTSWADSELQNLNPDLELSDTPVNLRSSARPHDLVALDSWMSRVDPEGWPNIPANLIATEEFDSEAVLTEVEVEGTLAVLPASFTTNNALTTISIQTAPDLEPVYVNTETIVTAGTQMSPLTTGSIVTAELDSSLPALPPPGSDTALEPWQAINQFVISVCAGPNEIAGRALALFALRLDSQGEMNSAGFIELPEPIRIAGVTAVSIGLPEPTIPPTDAPEEEVIDELPSEEPVEESEVGPTDMPSEEPTP